MPDTPKIPNPLNQSPLDLLAGLDHLPEEFQRFLRAVVGGLRAEGRAPSRLLVFPRDEASFENPYGVYRYTIKYADPNPDRFHDFMRSLTGEWR